MVLPGRKAVVTGGAQGIGYAIAQRMAQEGADVAILDLNLEAAEAAAATLAKETGRSVFAVKVDVSNEDSVEQAMNGAADRLGGLDLLVNNAGVLKSHFIADFPKKIGTSY